jgi:hypothetical protein
MAQGFFKHIPNINYDFMSDGNYRQAKDLFRKVSVWNHLQEGITGYSYYRITEGERPDVVAAKLYGDSTLYWLFWLVNENLQDLSDWPKSQRLFEKYIDRKYSGKCLVAANSTDIVSYDYVNEVSSKFVLGEKVSQSTSTYGFVTDVNPTHNRITVQIPESVVDTFTVASTVTGASSEKSFTISSVQNERDAINHYLDSNDKKVTFESYTSTASNTNVTSDESADLKYYNYSTANNTAVTNYRHELNLNEEKHLIRYIPGQYVERVIREFVNLVRD